MLEDSPGNIQQHTINHHSPVCRFVIDSSNVCCRDQGIVTSSYWADLKLVCSEPIVLAPTNTCVLATGPNSYSVRCELVECV